MKTMIYVILVLWIAGDGFAQETDEKPRRRVTLPAKKTEGTKEQVKPKPDVEGFELAFIDAVLPESIVPFVSELTGCKMLVVESLKTKKISAFTRQPVAGKEAIRFMEEALIAHGVAIVETANKTLLLVEANAKDGKLDFEPPVVVKREKLPDGQRVVDFVLKSETLDAEKLAAFFKDRIKLLPIGRIDAGPDGKSVVIRERAAVIRKMLELVDAMGTTNGQE